MSNHDAVTLDLWRDRIIGYRRDEVRVWSMETLRLVSSIPGYIAIVRIGKHFAFYATDTTLHARNPDDYSHVAELLVISPPRFIRLSLTSLSAVFTLYRPQLKRRRFFRRSLH